MRAFFCIPIEDATCRQIAQTSQQLRSSLRMRASWVPAENYHWTVRFLGEIEPMLTLDLERAAKTMAAEVLPFTLQIDRLGAFPSIQRARVIWAGGRSLEAFVNLVRGLNAEIESLGFEPERRTPAAHVTLARIKGVPDPKLATVIDELNPLGPFEAQCKRLVLMESQLGPGGARYDPLFDVPLVGRPGGR